MTIEGAPGTPAFLPDRAGLVKCKEIGYHDPVKVHLQPIDSIRPYDRNPRKNDSAVKAVAESIKRYGFRQPIVVDKEGTIIVGHTRWKAAKELGLAEVPVHVADMTEKQAREYRIADNKTNELAEWDLPALELEIKDLDLGWLPEPMEPPAEEWDDEQVGKAPPSPTVSILVPPRVWASSREQIMRSLEAAVEGYGTEIKWPS